MMATITIVGAGPAGIVVALELARKGHDVLLIESGGRRPDDRTQALGDATIVDPAKHVAMGLATRRQALLSAPARVLADVLKDVVAAQGNRRPGIHPAIGSTTSSG